MKIGWILVLFCLSAAGHSYRCPSSLKTLVQAVQKNPSNAVYLSQLADFHFQQKNYDTAIPYYRRSIQIAPDDSRVYLNLAVCLDRTDQPDRGRDLLTNIIRYFDKNPRLHSELGLLEYKCGRFPFSLSNYYQALSLDPDVKERQYLYAGLAKSYRELKDFDQSSQFFKKSLQIKDDCWVYYEYGKLFIDSQQSEQAVWAFERAVAYSFREDQKAKEMFSEKLALAYYSCGMKYKDAGKKALAVQQFKHILNDRALQKTSSAEKAAFWLKHL